MYWRVYVGECVLEKQKKTGDCKESFDTPRYCLQLQHTHTHTHTHTLQSGNEIDISFSSTIAQARPSHSSALILPQIVSPLRDGDREIETQTSQRNPVLCVAGIRGACLCTAALTCYIIWVDVSERGMWEEGHFQVLFIYRRKYLNSYLMDCRNIWYRHSWCAEGEF